MKYKLLSLALIASFSSFASANIIEFKDGQTIKSSDFNSNFTYLDNISSFNTTFEIDHDDSNISEIQIGGETLKKVSCSQSLVYYDPSSNASNNIKKVTVDYTHFVESSLEQCSAIQYKIDWLKPNTKIKTENGELFATSHILSNGSKTINVHIDEENPGLILTLNSDLERYNSDIEHSYRAIKEKVTNFKVDKITYE